MTPSLEHICRAFARGTCSHKDKMYQDGFVNTYWRDFEAQARRLLAAMREPHPDMSVAGSKTLVAQLEAVTYGLKGANPADDVWRSMIDAALSSDA